MLFKIKQTHCYNEKPHIKLVAEKVQPAVSVEHRHESVHKGKRTAGNGLILMLCHFCRPEYLIYCKCRNCAHRNVEQERSVCDKQYHCDNNGNCRRFNTGRHFLHPSKSSVSFAVCDNSLVKVAAFEVRP